MKKIIVIGLSIMALVASTFMTGIPVLGIIEALAIEPIAEVYPAVAFFGIFVVLGIMATIHSKNELLKELEVKSKEA